ncbi:MAG TPA: DNA adenine methylase [Chthonomonadales bacterium]|nr:DNA adenine methylase [Chthonomonadales bacterium]
MSLPVSLDLDTETGEWSATSCLLPNFVATAPTSPLAVERLMAAIRANADEYRFLSCDGSSADGAMVLREESEQLRFAMDVLDEIGIPGSGRGANRLAFGWYGGKYSHLAWLLPLLPESNHYCEPFGGSAAVLLNRTPSPVETYNDLDGEVVNFFAVLRDQGNELTESILLTPFSREELACACDRLAADLSRLERARRFYVRARQTRTGLAQTASPGRWATCRNTSRRGMGGAVSRWLSSAPDLLWIAARLLRVQIDNRPALEVIAAYDSPSTLFYCDPPYPHQSRGDTRAYAFEMTDDDHRKLAKALHRTAGKVAVSGYACPLMHKLYGDWRRIDAPAKPCHSTKEMRQEALWINYDLPDGVLDADT